MNKSQNKVVQKLEISDGRKFLIESYNHYKAEIKKANEWLNTLNHNKKIIKKLLEEVK